MNKDRRNLLIQRMRKKKMEAANGVPSNVFSSIKINKPPEKTEKEKREERRLAKIKEEEEAKKRIEDHKNEIFTMSFEKQRSEHEWNLEEFEKGRFYNLECDLEWDESRDGQGVSEYCICYQCRPEWHSLPGGSIWLSKERNKEYWENIRMGKEEGEREKNRLKQKEIDKNERRRKKAQLRQEQKRKEEEEKKLKEKKEYEERMLKIHEEYNDMILDDARQKRIQNIQNDGWVKYMSKTHNQIYWVNNDTKDKVWDIKMNNKYDIWCELDSYDNMETYWINAHNGKKSDSDPKKCIDSNEKKN